MPLFCHPSLACLLSLASPPAPSFHTPPHDPNALTNIPYSSWRPPACPQKCEGLCPHLPAGRATRVNGRLIQTSQQGRGEVGVDLEGVGAGAGATEVVDAIRAGHEQLELMHKDQGKDEGEDVVSNKTPVEQARNTGSSSVFPMVKSAGDGAALGDGSHDSVNDGDDDDDDEEDAAYLPCIFSIDDNDDACLTETQTQTDIEAEEEDAHAHAHGHDNNNDYDSKDKNRTEHEPATPDYHLSKSSANPQGGTLDHVFFLSLA